MHFTNDYFYDCAEPFKVILSLDFVDRIIYVCISDRESCYLVVPVPST